MLGLRWQPLLIIGCIVFLSLSLQVPHSVAGKSDEADRRWAAARATRETPANAILKDHWSLCLGDSSATRAFRSLFTESTFEYDGKDGGRKQVRYLLFTPTEAPARERRPLIV